MRRRLGTRYEIDDCSLHILAGSVDSAYTLWLTIPGTEEEDRALDDQFGFQMRFGCNVSFLGPYYVVRHRGTPEEEPYVREVAREIEATYVGYTPIPGAGERDRARCRAGYGWGWGGDDLSPPLSTHWGS